VADIVNETPWWYSGNEESSDPTPRFDPTALVAAANQLVDWATERFVTPHEDHADPQQHPTCVLCRSAAVLAGTGFIGGADAAAEDGLGPITWIPVRRCAEEEVWD
jgi:hypothetical protein